VSQAGRDVLAMSAAICGSVSNTVIFTAIFRAAKFHVIFIFLLQPCELYFESPNIVMAQDYTFQQSGRDEMFEFNICNICSDCSSSPGYPGYLLYSAVLLIVPEIELVATGT
jgi:hypothetical protein